MRFIPRRKRTWLLVLLGVLIVGATGCWWTATAKSEFERKFDQVKAGMTIEEATEILGSDGLWTEGQLTIRKRVSADDTEWAILTFTDDRLTEKQFSSPDIRDRLRRLWIRTFGSNPPF
jgi:hypothetical protein